MNCRGKSQCNSSNLRLNVNGEETLFAGPLCEHISVEASYYMMLFGHYQNGYMEQSGGVLDQTARYLTAMLVIGRIYGEWRKEAIKNG